MIPKTIDYKIEKDEIDIKTYLRKEKGISAKALTKLKVSGIFLNGEHAIVTRKMNKGDILSIVPEQQKDTDYIAENIPLDIIYDDENFLLINKPSYVTVYPAGEHMTGSLLNAFAYHYPNVVFRPIYRLDRNTSGIVCIAKNKIASVSTITKEYLAVCEGETPRNMYIDSKIGLAQGSRIKRCTGYGQEARTEFFKICSNKGHSLIKLKIYTGRTHQIRVHMSSVGYPLAGDDLYGGSIEFIKRHALHCRKICIENKAIGFSKEFLVEPPIDMKTSFSYLFKEELYASC